MRRAAILTRTILTPALLPLPLFACVDPSGPGLGGGDADALRASFQNDPDAVLASARGAYVCDLGASHLALLTLSEGQLALAIPDEQGQFTNPAVTGTYEAEGGQLRYRVDGVAESETTTEVEIEMDELFTFRSPSFLHCAVGGLGEGTGDLDAEYECPNTGFVGDVGFQTNKFLLSPDSGISWRHSDVFTAPEPDEVVSFRPGIYKQVGDRLLMGFGNSEEERFLTAEVSSDGAELTVLEIEPERGPCRRR